MTRKENGNDQDYERIQGIKVGKSVANSKLARTYIARKTFIHNNATVNSFRENDTFEIAKEV